MPTPFPGMDPYLERPKLWQGVHTQLIVGLGHAISRQVRPRYIVSIEERSYVTLFSTAMTNNVLDVMVVQDSVGNSILVELPMPEEVAAHTYHHLQPEANRQIIDSRE